MATGGCHIPLHWTNPVSPATIIIFRFFVCQCFAPWHKTNKLTHFAMREHIYQFVKKRLSLLFRTIMKPVSFLKILRIFNQTLKDFAKIHWPLNFVNLLQLRTIILVSCPNVEVDSNRNRKRFKLYFAQLSWSSFWLNEKVLLQKISKASRTQHSHNTDLALCLAFCWKFNNYARGATPSHLLRASSTLVCKSRRGLRSSCTLLSWLFQTVAQNISVDVED